MTELSPPTNSNMITLSDSDEEKSEQEEIQEPNVNLLRVKQIISSLSLTTVKVGDCLVIMRSEFDLNLCGEPYIGLMLLLDLKSGKYISRVWNQTVATGTVLPGNELMEACKNLFCRGRPCVGYPVAETVFPRKHSSTCSQVLGTDVGADVTTCRECSKQSTDHSISDVLIKEDLDGHKSDNCALDGDIAEDEEDHYDPVTSSTEPINMGDFLEDGIKVEHNKTDIKCPWCDEHFNSDCRGAFLNHQKRKHFWGNFKCSECTYEANFAQDLIDHIQGEEGHSKNAMVRCPHCRLDHSYVDMKSHYESCVNRYVQSEDGSNILTGTEKLEDLRDVATSPHKCDMCGKSYKSYSGLNKHKNKVRNLSQKYVSIGLKVPAIACTVLNTYSCSVCNEKFNTIGTLMAHCRWHGHCHGGLFKCPKCHAAAKNVALLIQHIKEADHYAKELFPECPCCKNKFSLDKLQHHYEGCVLKKQQIKQQKRKRFECPVCGKTITSKENLEHHINIHKRKQGLIEDEANSPLYFYCDKCGAKCVSKRNLKSHEKDQHSEGPFPCHHCGLEFDKFISLRTHRQREHRPLLQCDLCDYKTYLHNTLQRHKTTHFDPTFKCCYCGKMFAIKSSLEAHERRHRGEKPFSCTVCGASFSGKGNLRGHMRGAHGMKIGGGKTRTTGWGHKKKRE